MEGWTWKALCNEATFRFGKNLASSGIRTRDPVIRSRELSNADASDLKARTWTHSRSRCRTDCAARAGVCSHKKNIRPLHDKTNKMSVRPAKTQISLGIRPVWSESSRCAQWVAKDPMLLLADSEDSDQTGRMPRLIWVFAGRTAILLVLSCCGSYSLPGNCTISDSLQ